MAYTFKSLHSITIEGARPPVDFRERLRSFCLSAGFLALLPLTGFSLWLVIARVCYVPEMVTLDHVAEYCFVDYKKTNMIFPRPTIMTEDCKGLTLRIRKGELSLNGRLLKDTFVAFHYASPADGMLHQGLLRRRLNDAGQLAKPGDEITVHVSRLFTAVFTDWSSASATL